MNKYYNIFMTVYAITDTKKGEQGLRLLIFKLPKYSNTHNTEQKSLQITENTLTSMNIMC